VDPVPDSLLLRKSGSVGNRTRISGSVARNSDHWTTAAVAFHLFDDISEREATELKLDISNQIRKIRIVNKGFLS
jgi:hypothetical protein